MSIAQTNGRRRRQQQETAGWQHQWAIENSIRPGAMWFDRQQPEGSAEGEQPFDLSPLFQN